MGRAIRTLARAHRWKRLLEDGKYRSAGELAEAEWVTRRPDIVETILDGRQSKELPYGAAEPDEGRGFPQSSPGLQRRYRHPEHLGNLLLT